MSELPFDEKKYRALHAMAVLAECCDMAGAMTCGKEQFLSELRQLMREQWAEAAEEARLSSGMSPQSRMGYYGVLAEAKRRFGDG